MSEEHIAENDAPESVCSSCGMPGQCAACFLMETRGIPTPPRVIPPSCLCRDPLREVHAGCPLHGHSPESVIPPEKKEN